MKERCASLMRRSRFAHFRQHPVERRADTVEPAAGLVAAPLELAQGRIERAPASVPSPASAASASLKALGELLGIHHDLPRLGKLLPPRPRSGASARNSSTACSR